MTNATDHPPQNAATQELRIDAPGGPGLRAVPTQEWARFGLAVGFSSAYILIVIGLTVCSLWSFDERKVSTISAAIISPLGALVGGIVGFYFGTKKDV